MLSINSLIVLTAIFDNSLFIYKPPESSSCEIKLTTNPSWIYMKEKNYGGIEYYTILLNTSSPVISFRIRYNSNDVRRESSQVKVLNTNFTTQCPEFISLIVLNSIGFLSVFVLSTLILYQIRYN